MFSHLSLLYLLLLAGTEAERVRVRGTNTISSLTPWLIIRLKTLMFFSFSFRKLVLIFAFSLIIWFNRTERDLTALLFSVNWMKPLLLVICDIVWELSGNEAHPLGLALLSKTVLERRTGFIFLFPLANSIFLQNYTGQPTKANFAMRKSPQGRRFVSQMEVFHVVNKVQ